MTGSQPYFVIFAKCKRCQSSEEGQKISLGSTPNGLSRQGFKDRHPSLPKGSTEWSLEVPGPINQPVIGWSLKNASFANEASDPSGQASSTQRPCRESGNNQLTGASLGRVQSSACPKDLGPEEENPTQTPHFILIYFQALSSKHIFYLFWQIISGNGIN